ncbi:hypothetical protein Tco_0651211 [Tanacetum coccineum]
MKTNETEGLNMTLWYSTYGRINSWKISMKICIEKSKNTKDIFLNTLDVQEAYSAHNVFSCLHPPSFQQKLNALSLDDLANVYNVQALYLAMAGNKLTNEYRIISRDLSKLKDDFVLLKSKNGSLEHEISKLENNLLKARNDQDLEGSQLVKDLRSEGVRLHGEVESLTNRLNLADLERVELIRNVLPLAVKKLTPSDQFNQAMGDLQ